MTNTYQITGMTCTGCQAKVTSLLLQLPEVQQVDVSLPDGTAAITMSAHIPTTTLKAALAEYPKYQLSETADMTVSRMVPMDGNPEKTWLQTYKPILLIAGYLLVIAVIAGYNLKVLRLKVSMRVFMSGFFLAFSFFKLLDMRGFADSYATYDLVARRWRGWGYVYVFIELGIGLAFALNVYPVVIYWFTFVVMAVSLAGVVKSVLAKQQIRCACLGAVFNLPMSTVTIVEDGLMIVMSITMIIIR